MKPPRQPDHKKRGVNHADGPHAPPSKAPEAGEHRDERDQRAQIDEAQQQDPLKHLQLA